MGASAPHHNTRHKPQSNTSYTHEKTTNPTQPNPTQRAAHCAYVQPWHQSTLASCKTLRGRAPCTTRAPTAADPKNAEAPCATAVHAPLHTCPPCHTLTHPRHRVRPWIHQRHQRITSSRQARCCATAAAAGCQRARQVPAVPQCCCARLLLVSSAAVALLLLVAGEPVQHRFHSHGVGLICCRLHPVPVARRNLVEPAAAVTSPTTAAAAAAEEYTGQNESAHIDWVSRAMTQDGRCAMLRCCWLQRMLLDVAASGCCWLRQHCLDESCTGCDMLVQCCAHLATPRPTGLSSPPAGQHTANTRAAVRQQRASPGLRACCTRVCECPRCMRRPQHNSTCQHSAAALAHPPPPLGGNAAAWGAAACQRHWSSPQTAALLSRLVLGGGRLPQCWQRGDGIKGVQHRTGLCAPHSALPSVLTKHAAQHSRPVLRLPA